MDVFQKMIGTQALYLLYAAVGVVLRLVGVINDGNRKSYVSFLMYVAMPCLIFNSFYGEYEPRDLVNGAGVLAVSAAVCLLGFGLGWLLFRNKAERAVLIFGSAFSNAGNAGLVVIASVYGKEGAFYASIYLMPVVILLWTMGVSVFAKKGKGFPWKATLLSPTMIALEAGLVILFAGIKLPGVLENGISAFGGMTAPLVMVIVGTNLVGIDYRSLLDKNVVCLCLLRLVGIPLAVFGGMRLLRMDPIITAVAVTLSAMPIASNTVVLAEKYNAGGKLASNCVAVSTVACAVTVSLLTLMMQYV